MPTAIPDHTPYEAELTGSPAGSESGAFADLFLRKANAIDARLRALEDEEGERPVGDDCRDLLLEQAALRPRLLACLVLAADETGDHEVARRFGVQLEAALKLLTRAASVIGATGKAPPPEAAKRGYFTLSEWAAFQGVDYETARKQALAGAIPGVCRKTRGLKNSPFIIPLEAAQETT